MVVAIGCMVSCANLFPQAPPQQPSPDDQLQLAWKGHPTIDVESHPVFSMMESRRQELSDGTMILHHQRCANWKEPDHVNGAFGANWTATTVHHGAQGTFCCDRQFVIRDGVVEAYRQVPSMGGTCSAEPALFPGRRAATY